MTRNTKFYKIKGKDPVYYRNLTTVELSVLSNIKNAIIQKEMAANIAIYGKDPDAVPFETKVQIGEDVLYISSRIITDPTFLDIAISDFRTSITEGEPILAWISNITRCFPGTSVIDLLNLTPADLVELVVLSEEMTGDKIFGAKQKKTTLINPNNLADGGKALREQIKTLNQNLDSTRR